MNSKLKSSYRRLGLDEIIGPNPLIKLNIDSNAISRVYKFPRDRKLSKSLANDFFDAKVCIWLVVSLLVTAISHEDSVEGFISDLCSLNLESFDFKRQSNPYCWMVLQFKIKLLLRLRMATKSLPNNCLLLNLLKIDLLRIDFRILERYLALTSPKVAEIVGSRPLIVLDVAIEAINTIELMSQRSIPAGFKRGLEAGVMC